ncbi:putative ribonuclease H-like domain-containing protein [Tanacetum coccineum]
MCDKKNSVLFTETKCLVLSPDFKLIDESQVLLRVPRQNNMYSFDLKNVVPTGDLTCLFTKATIDESKLWHRRLGHVNFKIMNKLMKGNLIRGLPLKTFENDHTCVACQKGKQHKASSTQSETSGILKKFITEVENQLNHKVKVIRSDNGTEFKHREIDEFCRQKGIKREYSVARTPQQNRVAERKNKTLIEAARTMLADSLLPIVFWAEKTPRIRFMRPFGCPVTILNTLDPLGKFDGKAEEGFLVGYSIHSKAFRSLDDKVGDATTNDDGIKNVQEPSNKYDQAMKNVLEKIMNQEKEVTEQSDAVRKEFEAQCNSQLLQEKVTRASSINSFNTVSTPVNTASASRTFSLIGPSSKPSFDPLMPKLEDIAKIQSTSIFGNAYDDDDLETYNSPNVDESVGAEANLNNMEPSTVVSPIPTTRIHSIHPKD